MKLLIADDNPDGREIMKRFLTRLGYDCHFVTDGRKCLDSAMTGEYALVILDMNMPELTGWQVAERIRVNFSYDQLPIIALTAHAMSGDREKCLAAGCTDYLTKPVDLQKLRATIQQLLPAQTDKILV